MPREETEDLLAQARAQGRGVMGSASASFDDDDEETPRKKGRSKENAGTVADGEEKAETVVKVMKTESEYFNTVSQNAPGSSLITAIIDENIKAVDGSRVRVRSEGNLSVCHHVRLRKAARQGKGCQCLCRR